jgi:hypothetical protein
VSLKAPQRVVTISEFLTRGLVVLLNFSGTEEPCAVWHRLCMHV